MDKQKYMYKPIVIEGELYGKQLNPFGQSKPVFFPKFPLDKKLTAHAEFTFKSKLKKWISAQEKLMTFKVCRNEYVIYKSVEITIKWFSDGVTDLHCELKLTDIFTADIVDNQLTNLKTKC